MLFIRKQKKQPLAAFFVCGTLLLFANVVLLAEFLNTSGRVDDFLLAGVERMASRANLDMQWLVHRGTGGEAIAATACNSNFVVLGMDACFHIALPGSEPGKRGIIHKNTHSGKRLRKSFSVRR
jgi:hypothetical protein